MIVSYQVPRAAEARPWSAMVSRYLIFNSFSVSILGDTKFLFLKYSVMISEKFISLI